MQPSAFANHARSKLHRAAAGEFLDEVGLSPAEAPPVSDFAAVLQAVWSGEGATANAGEWKFRKMLWALAEARRDQLRKALGMATSISVNQDARAGRLVIGFSCADSQSLEAATGYFSQVNLYEEGFEADAKGVYLATVYAVYKLCTRRLGSPCEFRAGADPPELMRELLEHIRQCTEAFSADAAADEQRAGSLLRGFFKGLLIRQWDKAHACKRVLSRTFRADAYLKEIAERLVLSKQAVTQKIHWSRAFRALFRQAVAQLTGRSRSQICSLAAAKHRFTSYATPFRRAVLFFVPLVRVAQTILDTRGKTSEEGDAARQWLLSLDGESALQMALMAEAADEALTLNRYFDQGRFENSNITSQLQFFLQRCTYLFDQRGASRAGYGAFMLSQLRVKRTIIIDGVARAVAYPTAEQQDRCYQRMQNWLQLARWAIRADFPSFETLQLFRFLNLDAQPKPADMEALASVLWLDPSKLQMQCEQLRPVALWHRENGSASDTAAWVSAFKDGAGNGKYAELAAVVARPGSFNS